MAYCGLTPKDHRKDNLNFIKAKQEELKRRLEEESKPKPEPFKLKKFANVPSKLSTVEATASSPSKARPQTSGSARARSFVNAHVAFGRTTIETDYSEKENVCANVSTVEAVATPTLSKHKSFGKVPTYIERFKLEAQVTRQKREEDRARARMPPGTRLMSEEERVATLEELARQKREVSYMLFSIPLSCKTEALRLRKREIEVKLVEIDRAVTTFSRKIVYIKDDELPPGTIPVEVAY
jgi:phage terminase Nu1 subunit (DNA packaging protein)